MRIEVYELKKTAAGWVIDEKRHVATIAVKDNKGQIQCRDQRREKLMRHLFEQDAISFVAGGKMPDGSCVDAVVSYPAWSSEAIDLIIGEKLRGYTLGAKVVER